MAVRAVVQNTPCRAKTHVQGQICAPLQFSSASQPHASRAHVSDRTEISGGMCVVLLLTGRGTNRISGNVRGDEFLYEEVHSWQSLGGPIARRNGLLSPKSGGGSSPIIFFSRIVDKGGAWLHRFYIPVQTYFSQISSNFGPWSSLWDCSTFLKVQECVEIYVNLPNRYCRKYSQTLGKKSLGLEES